MIKIQKTLHKSCIFVHVSKFLQLIQDFAYLHVLIFSQSQAYWYMIYADYVITLCPNDPAPDLWFNIILPDFTRQTSNYLRHTT